MTTYIILRADPENADHPDGSMWRELPARAVASSPKRALASISLKPGEYVAVPVRSWKPLTVTVEQTTKVTIG